MQNLHIAVKLVICLLTDTSKFKFMWLNNFWTELTGTKMFKKHHYWKRDVSLTDFFFPISHWKCCWKTSVLHWITWYRKTDTYTDPRRTMQYQEKCRRNNAKRNSVEESTLKTTRVDNFQSRQNNLYLKS